MSDEIKWIRMKVGMFDGNSFKKIKRAKIGGVSYRNVLTAVWFELLDLAAKCNANGYLIDKNSIPFSTYEDIATQIDREEKEVELCMNFFEAEKMIEFTNDTYCLTNFVQYQNQEGLDQIRAQNRERQARFKERKRQLLLTENVDNSGNVTDNVIKSLPVTLPITQSNIQRKEKVEQKEKEILLAKDIKEKITNACMYAQGAGRFDKPIELIIKAMTFACQNEKSETYADKQRDSDYWLRVLEDNRLPNILAKTVNSLTVHEPERDEVRYTLGIIASESDKLGIKK